MTNRDAASDDSLEVEGAELVEESAAPTYAIYAAPDNGRGVYGIKDNPLPLYRKLFQTTDGKDACETYWRDHILERTSKSKKSHFGAGYEYLIGTLGENGVIQPLKGTKYAKRYANKVLLTGEVEKYGNDGQEVVIIPE